MGVPENLALGVSQHSRLLNAFATAAGLFLSFMLAA